MARMPNVQFLGISASAMPSHDIVCVHTIVGYQSGGNAAHFTTGANGKIVQARDTKVQSAANLNGNHRVIAIENEDHGAAYGNWNTSDGHAVPGFTAAQKEAIAKILKWCHTEHGIPLALIPDSKPGRRGVAYHRQGIPGNFSGFDFPGIKPGGEVWTSFRGKVCPGDRRIRQLVNEIIPRARVLAGLEDDEVSAAELWGYENPAVSPKDAFGLLYEAQKNPWAYKNTQVDTRDAFGLLKSTVDDVDLLKAKVDAIDSKLDVIQALLEGGT